MNLLVGSTVTAYKKNPASSSTKFANVTVTEVAGAYLSISGASGIGFGPDIVLPWDSVDYIILVSDPPVDPGV